jgi:mRNA-degrading endonuclease RelE of RelBE toxin-antitoxin system
MSAIALYLFQSKNCDRTIPNHQPSPSDRSLLIQPKNCDRKPHFPRVIKLQGDAQLYRVRVGDYRVVFSRDNREKILTVNRVKHRQDVYE